MGKIQGDAVKTVDDAAAAAAAAAAETHKAPVKPSTSKKNMRLFTMRRKAIAELTKECSDMQKAGDPGGQERCVHIQLALEQIIAQMTSSLKFMESSSCSWLCVKD